MSAPESALTEPQNSMTPFEYMDLADRVIVREHFRYAAALMWKAVETVFLQLASDRGLDIATLKEEHEEEFYRTHKLSRGSGYVPIDYRDQADPSWNLDLNLPSRDLTALAIALEADPSVLRLRYSSYLVAASVLYDHALMDVMDNYQLEWAYDYARKFVLEFVRSGNKVRN